jgi:hypothetical protein
LCRVDEPGLPPEDPRATHMGDLVRQELGRTLQPQQGPHEVLPSRKQVLGSSRWLQCSASLFHEPTGWLDCPLQGG